MIFAHAPRKSAQGRFSPVAGAGTPVVGDREAEDLLDDGVRIARRAGFEPSPQLLAADRRTSEIIVSAADEHDAIVIAMGQRRRSAVGKLMLGSVTREVVTAHHQPVLVSGPGGPGVYPQ